jgi:serine acetyltransferase
MSTVSQPSSRFPAVPAAEDWRDPAPTRPLPFWRSAFADVVAHVPPPQRPTSRWRWALIGLRVLLFSTGFRTVLTYRLAHTARARLGLPGRCLAAALYWWGRHWYGCTLSPEARLHGGLILPHAQGIVIGQAAVVGPRAWIFQNVTFGGAPGKVGLPVVGADARIYAGAVLTGPVRLGDNVMVGANAVVVCDVPSRMIVRPAAVDIQLLPARFLADGY